MAKKIHDGPTPLDGEIERFLVRIGGEGRPMSHVRQYAVNRQIGKPHIVVVEFVADAEFDAPQAAGTDD